MFEEFLREKEYLDNYFRLRHMPRIQTQKGTVSMKGCVLLNSAPFLNKIQDSCRSCVVEKQINGRTINIAVSTVSAMSLRIAVRLSGGLRNPLPEILHFLLQSRLVVGKRVIGGNRISNQDCLHRRNAFINLTKCFR